MLKRSKDIVDIRIVWWILLFLGSITIGWLSCYIMKVALSYVCCGVWLATSTCYDPSGSCFTCRGAHHNVASRVLKRSEDIVDKITMWWILCYQHGKKLEVCHHLLLRCDIRSYLGLCFGTSSVHEKACAQWNILQGCLPMCTWNALLAILYLLMGKHIPVWHTLICTYKLLFDM